MANKRTSGTLSRLPERTYGLICSVVTPTDLYGTSEYLKANHISNRHHFEQPFSTNVMTSHIATPNAHTSVLSENIFFVRLSFAMYRIGSRASRSSFQKSSPCCRYRACPKSPSLSTLFSPTRMFLTAMSRCSMRFCQTCESWTCMLKSQSYICQVNKTVSNLHSQMQQLVYPQLHRITLGLLQHATKILVLHELSHQQPRLACQDHAVHLSSDQEALMQHCVDGTLSMPGPSRPKMSSASPRKSSCSASVQFTRMSLTATSVLLASVASDAEYTLPNYRARVNTITHNSISRPVLVQ